MITLIEALNYRCLRYNSQPLGPFHVLVGPNASGKSTFLDVISFLGSFITDGLETAISQRTQNFQDLVWGRRGTGFELAIEAKIPENKRELLNKNNTFNTIRYELSIEFDTDLSEISITAERGLLLTRSPIIEKQNNLFPESVEPPKSILQPKSQKGVRSIFTKAKGGNDNYYSEVEDRSGKGWMPAFKLGPKKSTLSNLPEDESRFPVATWLKGLLSEGIQKLVLNSELIRKASPPGQGRGFNTDGSNLPWVIDDLKKKDNDNFIDWLSHLQTALPDIENIHIIERPDDKHKYLMLVYKGGLKIPSWVASDGTLRLLALTLPAYLPDLTGIFLIEEPENGIHPQGVETMFQSLSSVYDAQIIMATHSPIILSMVEADKVLCFAKTQDGVVDIVAGDKHPALRDWQGETNLGTLFASGVLS